MDTIFLQLKYDSDDVAVAICFTKREDICDNVFSKTELKKYEQFKVKSARDKFLLGRLAAKKAYLYLSKKNLAMNDIEIRNGVFNNPVLEDPYFDVSISHANNVAAGLVFDRSFPMGIDVEAINPSKIDALSSVTTSEEIGGTGDDLFLLTVAWCMKEALSKAIRTGFTIPLDLLAIREMTQIDEMFVCVFENFAQYKGYAKKISDDSVFAVVCPKQLMWGR